MTNRARPTWPDGADSGKSERPSGSSGKSQSTPPATPASNGRSTGNGQPRPGTVERPAAGRFPPAAPSVVRFAAGRVSAW